MHDLFLASHILLIFRVCLVSSAADAVPIVTVLYCLGNNHQEETSCSTQKFSLQTYSTVEGLQGRSDGHGGTVALGKLNSPTRLSYVRSLSNSSLCTCFKTEVVNIGLLASPFIFGHPSFPPSSSWLKIVSTLPAPTQLLYFLPIVMKPLPATILTTSPGRQTSFHVTSEQLVCSVVAVPSLVVFLYGHVTIKKATLCVDPILLQVRIYFLLCLDLDISNWTYSPIWMTLPLCSVRNE